MIKKGLFILMLTVCSLLSGCLGSIWTGASLVYDRHHVYKKMSDYQLSAQVYHRLFGDDTFKQAYCAIDVAVLNGDILLAGHVPTLALRQMAQARVEKIPGYRRLFNELNVNKFRKNTLADSWITAKIRSQIFADATIDPNAFKIITSDRIVYLMGDVKPEEAKRVIDIARMTNNVERVVKLFKYYNLSEKPAYTRTGSN